MENETAQYRVVQWATGNIGTRSLHGVIEHPGLTLAGLYVYSPDKAGRDAGELCGLGATGVLATRDIEEILALEADCVLYMPQACNYDDVCRLLESGTNIVTTRGEFHHPASMDPSTRERVEAACRRGGTSIHSTGSSPGFISEAVPLVLASIQRRLEGLTIEEYADMSSRPSPEMIFDLMGFGRDPGSFSPDGLAMHGASSFSGSLHVLADALSLPLDDVTATAEVAVSCHGADIAAGRIDAGTIAAQRILVTGTHQARPLLRFVANWYVATDLDPAWRTGDTGWHVLVEGDLPLDLVIRFPVPDEDWAAVSPGVTAHRPVNAIAYVCAAEPGIRTTADLPNVTANLRR